MAQLILPICFAAAYAGLIPAAAPLALGLPAVAVAPGGISSLTASSQLDIRGTPAVARAISIVPQQQQAIISQQPVVAGPLVAARAVQLAAPAIAIPATAAAATAGIGIGSISLAAPGLKVSQQTAIIPQAAPLLAAAPLAAVPAALALQQGIPLTAAVAAPATLLGASSVIKTAAAPWGTGLGMIH